MNNKGLLRIAEAVVAIILIISVLFVFYIGNRTQTKVDLSENARDILEEISKNSTLRREIISYNPASNDPTPPIIVNFVSDRIKDATYSYEIKICEVDDVCGKSEYTPGNVYTGERIISSTLNDLGPRKIRLFIW